LIAVALHVGREGHLQSRPREVELGAGERDYPVFRLERGPLPRELTERLMPMIRKFQPLDFEAAGKAKAWLETSVSSGSLGFDTHLALSEDLRRIIGFIALGEEEVEVAPGDLPIMEARKVIKNPSAKKQRALKLVWIARCRTSPPGFGNDLFDHALVVALEAGGCAVMVEPYDEATAKKLWLDHFELRKPRDGAADWQCLWYALGQPPQEFC
jgi:hypothetical protein